MPDGMICNAPDCQQTDDHPAYHLYVNVREAKFGEDGPSTKVYHEHDQDQNGWLNYHHDCAAALGHAKAQTMMQHIGDAKGDELRALLNDPNHPVHQAVRDHSEREAQEIHEANLAALSEAPDDEPATGPSAGVVASAQ